MTIKRLAFAFGAIALLSSGCHKKDAPPAATQSQGTSPAPQTQPISGEIDQNLTALLRQFVQKNGRMPQTFRELVRATMDSAPQAPEGKKWEIDASDTTVKAVPK